MITVTLTDAEADATIKALRESSSRFGRTGPDSTPFTQMGWIPLEGSQHDLARALIAKLEEAKP